MIKKFDKKDEESGTRGAPDAHPQAQGSPFPRSQPPAPGAAATAGSPRSPSPGAGASPRAACSGPAVAWSARRLRPGASPPPAPAPRPSPSEPALRGAPSGGEEVRAHVFGVGLLVGLGPRASTPVLGPGVDRAMVACSWTQKGLDSPVPRG